MRKFFILLAVIGLCGFFAEKAQAQSNWCYRHNFLIHAGYAPEKITQKTSLGEKNAVQYQGFYVGGLYSSGIFAIGPQLRYQYLGSSNNDAAINGILPEKQLLVELPVLVYFPAYFCYTVKTFPFIGAMPSYKYNFGTSDDYKPFDVYGLAGLLIGWKHLNVYLGLRAGLLDIDKCDDTKTSAFGMFYGLGYSF